MIEISFHFHQCYQIAQMFSYTYILLFGNNKFSILKINIFFLDFSTKKPYLYIVVRVKPNTIPESKR
jgi:hypothetical protein